MALTIGLISFLLLAGVITYYGYRVYFRPGRVYERVESESPAPSEPLSSMGTREDLPVVRIIRTIGEKVPISPADAGLTRRYLLAAGYRSERALSVFNGCKVVATGLLLLFGIAVKGLVTTHNTLQMVVVAGAALLGWFGPGMVLDHLISKRQSKLRAGLPDALDLMVVCVEAGHGLDQAFVRVARELKITHPEVCEEFAIANLEMRAGKRRGEALQNLSSRTGEPELQKLVSVMIQADRFGTSIGDSLRVHADYMRLRRRQDAEERAGKVGVKLIFPIFLFILPSMFMVTAGPGVLQMIKYLLPALREAGK